jgi:hypothetical protein
MTIVWQPTASALTNSLAAHAGTISSIHSVAGDRILSDLIVAGQLYDDASVVPHPTIPDFDLKIVASGDRLTRFGATELAYAPQHPPWNTTTDILTIVLRLSEILMVARATLDRRHDPGVAQYVPIADVLIADGQPVLDKLGRWNAILNPGPSHTPLPNLNKLGETLQGLIDDAKEFTKYLGAT